GAARDRVDAVERRAAARTVDGDDGRVDLRSRAGGTESGALGRAALRARTRARGRRPAMSAAGEAPAARSTVTFDLDGCRIDALAGESILAAARRHGVEIPHLCHRDGYRPDGNCRACVVEIEGERALAPSCCRAPTAGMKVRAHGDRARAAQRLVVELLLADAPESDRRSEEHTSELQSRENLVCRLLLEKKKDH